MSVASVYPGGWVVFTLSPIMNVFGMANPQVIQSVEFERFQSRVEFPKLVPYQPVAHAKTYKRDIEKDNYSVGPHHTIPGALDTSGTKGSIVLPLPLFLTR